MRDKPQYGVTVTQDGVRFTIGNQQFTLTRTELDPDDPESADHQRFMASMLLKALNNLAGD